MRLCYVVASTIVLCLPTDLMAAVTPVMIKLESDGTNYLATYTVPQNKILIIDAIQFNTLTGIELVSTNGAVFKMSRRLMSGDGYAPLTYSEGLYSLNRSIKIPSEVVLRAPLASSGTNSACVYASLVDTDDLYAQAPPSVLEFTPTFAEGIAILAVSAGADSVIRVEQCPDISGEDWRTTATFATGISPERTMALANEDSSRQFFRLRTLSR